MLFKIIIDEDTEAVEGFAQNKCPYQAPHDPWKLIKLLLGNDFVNDVSRQLRVNKSKGEREDGATNGTSCHPFVGSNVMKDTTHDFCCAAFGSPSITGTFFATEGHDVEQ